MLNIPVTAPINWEPLPSIFLDRVIADGKPMQQFAPGLTAKIKAGEIVIETRKRGKIYWRKNQMRLL